MGYRATCSRVNLADFCGPEEAFHSGESQGAEKHELEHVHVQLPSSSHNFPHTPVLPDPPILLLPPSPHAILGVAAGGEPGWSWTTARRPHRGPRGGDPAREAAPARTPHSPMCRPLEVRVGCQWVAKNERDGVCRLGGCVVMVGEGL